MGELWKAEVGGLRASRLVGVKYRTLDGWVRTGLLPETATPAEGKGTKRGFALADLVRARAVKFLRGEGVSMQTIRKALAELDTLWAVTEPLLQGKLVVAGSKLFWALDDKALLDILTGQLAARSLVIVPVGAMVSEMRAALLLACA